MSATTAIVMNLRDYEQLAEKYIVENFPEDEQLVERLRLSSFIVWARNQVSEPERRLQLVKGGNNER